MERRGLYLQPVSDLPLLEVLDPAGRRAPEQGLDAFPRVECTKFLSKWATCFGTMSV